MLPAACTVTAVALGLLLPQLDAAVVRDRLPLLFPGGPAGARELLSSIISSMISFTGLVFSITIVVLQLTSSQFSPRVLRTFLDDRGNQLALGIFVATFVYALTVMRVVRAADEGVAFVPRISVTFAFALVLASVTVFIYYIHHISHSIRVASIVTAIGDETRRALDKQYPVDPRPEPAAPERGPLCRIVHSPRPGVLAAIDTVALVRRAAHADLSVHVKHPLGTFLPTGAALAEVTGSDPGALSDRDVLAAVQLRRERSIEQDPGFGLRQLVDIAERALSPAINDPTTALQAIDQLHDLLRRAAQRPTPTGRYADEGGTCRLVVPVRGFVDFLDLAVDEIALSAERAPRVRSRLRSMLDDVASIAPRERAERTAVKTRSLDVTLAAG